MWSFHHVCWTGGKEAAWLEYRKVSLKSPGQGNLVNKRRTTILITITWYVVKVVFKTTFLKYIENQILCLMTSQWLGSIQHTGWTYRIFKPYQLTTSYYPRRNNLKILADTFKPFWIKIRSKNKRKDGVTTNLILRLARTLETQLILPVAHF